MDEIAKRFSTSQSQEHGLGTSQYRLQIRASLIGGLRHAAGGADQPPINGVTADDAGEVLHPNRGWQIGKKLREEGMAPGGLEAVPTRQLVGDRDLVDG